MSAIKKDTKLDIPAPPAPVITLPTITATMLSAMPQTKFPMANRRYEIKRRGFRPKMLLSFPYNGWVLQIESMYPVSNHEALSRLLKSEEIWLYVASTRDVSALERTRLVEVSAGWLAANVMIITDEKKRQNAKQSSAVFRFDFSGLYFWFIIWIKVVCVVRDIRK